MVTAPVEAVSRAHAQGRFMNQQVAAIGLGRIARAAELETSEQLRPKAVMKSQIEGLAGKKLWGQRQGPMGTSETIQNHAGHRFARREHCLWIGHEASVHHGHDAQGFDDRRAHA
jgi:hypothetical protein